MSMHHLHHLLHGAHKASESGNHKVAGLIYIGAGFFLTPFLIGIPMMGYGIYKLFK